MEFDEYVRKPFTVEAVEITVENIGEIAEFVGLLCHKKNGPYIRVNPDLVPNIPMVYPGFWMTKMDDNVRCYSKRAFEEQFIKNTENIKDWVNFMNQDPEIVETTPAT